MENFRWFDVGPVTRQVSTRTRGFFGGPYGLTLCAAQKRGEVPFWPAGLYLPSPLLVQRRGLKSKTLQPETMRARSSNRRLQRLITRLGRRPFPTARE